MSPHPPHGTTDRLSWRRRFGIDEVWVQGKLSSRMFLGLRWLALLGQSATLLVADRLGLEVPWAICLSALGFTLASNLVLEWWHRRHDGELGGSIFHVALWDIVSLTALLHGTGGLDNPFAIFFLVQLTVVTVALRYEGVAGLTLLVLCACAYLWFDHHPLVTKEGQPFPELWLARGRLVALVLAGGTILLLLVSIRRQSFALQNAHRILQEELATRDRFLSVATLATGFAHELATPLGTIGMAADELVERPGTEETQSLPLVIRNEVARCKEVLDRLRSLGQEASASHVPFLEAGTLVGETLAHLLPEESARIAILLPPNGTACLRGAGLREALLVVLRNALHWSPAPGRIELTVSAEQDPLFIDVTDEGPGFDDAALRHWGEPFFTTREEGLGLGLYFVRRLLASQGGRVEITNRAEGGARVRLILPKP